MSQSCYVLRGGDRGEHLQCIKGMAITLTVYVPFLFTLFKTKHVPLFSSFKFTKANENLHYSRTKRWFKEPFLPDQKSKEKQVLHTNLPPGKNLTFIDRIACQPSSTQEISSYTDSWGRRSWFNISRYPRWYLIAKRDILQGEKSTTFTPRYTTLPPRPAVETERVNDYVQCCLVLKITKVPITSLEK